MHAFSAISRELNKDDWGESGRMGTGEVAGRMERGGKAVMNSLRTGIRRSTMSPSRSRTRPMNR